MVMTEMESVNLRTEQYNYSIWKTENWLEKKKNEQACNALWDINKRPNMYIIKVSDEEGKVEKSEKV